MSRFTVVEEVPGLFIVMRQEEVIGYVARGDLHECSDGRLIIRGQHWVVIGHEYMRFKCLTDAAEALFAKARHLTDASMEIMIVRRLESIAPIYRRVSRRSTEKSVKDITRDVCRDVRESKRDYHDSLQRAGISKYVH